MKNQKKSICYANCLVVLSIILSVQGCQSFTNKQGATDPLVNQNKKPVAATASPAVPASPDWSDISGSPASKDAGHSADDQTNPANTVLPAGISSVSDDSQVEAYPPVLALEQGTQEKPQQLSQQTVEQQPGKAIQKAPSQSSKPATEATSRGARTSTLTEKATLKSGIGLSAKVKAEVRQKRTRQEAGISQGSAASARTEATGREEAGNPGSKLAVDSAKPTVQTGQSNKQIENTPLAMVTPPVSKSLQQKANEATHTPSLKLSEDQLPYTLGAWTLERNWDNQHPQTCRLRSAKESLNDGYDMTWLWAEILPNELKVHTGSNIDLSYEGSGVRFGKGTTVPFSGFLSETAVSLAGDFSDKLKTSGSLTVSLGFWPTWPKTETRTVQLPTGELLQAIAALEQCQQWSD